MYSVAGLIIVVRTGELRKFEQSLIEMDQVNNSSGGNIENPKATASLLKMVIAMAVEGYRYDPLSPRSRIPAEIVHDVEKLGLSIDADTVRKWLNEGAELIDQEILNKS